MAGSTRQEIVELLRGSRLSAKQISQALGIREREVYEHLGHVRLTMAAARDERLEVEPARCRGCGFSFRKRDRLTTPSRCPVCRGEHIAPPLFEVAGRDRRARPG